MREAIAYKKKPLRHHYLITTHAVIVFCGGFLLRMCGIAEDGEGEQWEVGMKTRKKTKKTDDEKKKKKKKKEKEFCFCRC